MIILLMFPAYSYADTFVYLKYVDENGVVHFTDSGPVRKPRKPAAVKSPKKQATPAAYTNDYHVLIDKHSDKYGIDPHLVKAVIKTESGFNANAVSKKGAMGLMQLMPSTAYLLGVSNPFNPDENIEGGVRYLKDLIKKYNGDLQLALAAYNAGPGRVEKYGAVPPIKETKNYVEKVFSLYKQKKTIKTSTGETYYKIVLEDGTILYTNSRYQ